MQRTGEREWRIPLGEVIFILYLGDIILFEDRL